MAPYAISINKTHSQKGILSLPIFGAADKNHKKLM
jgi:hypothetical protein